MEKEQLKFRNLTKDEIEVRVGGGKSLLLYKTARVDAKVVDETVGVCNWQKRFYQVKNTMMCAVAINVNYNNPTKEPVWVENTEELENFFYEAEEKSKKALVEIENKQGGLIQIKKSE